MKKLNHSLAERFAFAVFTLVINPATVLLPILASAVIPNTQTLVRGNADYVFVLFLYLLASLAVCCVLYDFFLKNTAKTHFDKNDTQSTCIKRALGLVLPGEILRMIVNLLSINTGFKYFLSPVYMLCEELLLNSVGHYHAYFEEHGFVLYDYVAFLICYLVYFFVVLAMLLYIYHKHWKRAKFDSEDMVVYGKVERPKLYK